MIGRSCSASPRPWPNCRPNAVFSSGSPISCAVGQRLTIPVKHGEGCFFADPDRLAELEEGRQIALRYDDDNPNGSLDDIAGVVNAEGNVMGLMPHPEHAVDPLLGSTDGALVLGALVEGAREALHATTSAG